MQAFLPIIVVVHRLPSWHRNNRWTGSGGTGGGGLVAALPKIGLRTSPLVGDLYVADIPVPPHVTAAFGAPAPRFGRMGLLRVEIDPAAAMP